MRLAGKSIIVACSMLALTGCAMPGIPGIGGMMGMPGLGGMDPVSAAMASANMTTMNAGNNLMVQQQLAQANANRPGDERLTCDQMQTEMTAMFEDPQFVGAVATLGAQAQSQMAQQQKAAANATAAMTTMTMVGAASSFIPGGGWLAQGVMQAQMASAVAEMGPAAQRGADMMTTMSAVMPQMMRGQRLNELATAKKCAFLDQAAKPT